MVKKIRNIKKIYLVNIFIIFILNSCGDISLNQIKDNSSDNTIKDSQNNDNQTINKNNQKPNDNIDKQNEINNIIPDFVEEGKLEVKFKDDYKVRYFGNNIFYSKSGKDLCGLNSILKKYNVLVEGVDLSKVDSEDIYEKEKVQEVLKYNLTIKNINPNKIIEELKINSSINELIYLKK